MGIMVVLGRLQLLQVEKGGLSLKTPVFQRLETHSPAGLLVRYAFLQHGLVEL